MSHLDTTDPTFVHDLAASSDAVWRVARALWNRQQSVTVRAVHVRPTVDDVEDYADLGDLELVQRIEVKHRTRVDFTCMDDLARLCRGGALSVASVRSWDRAHPKPHAVVICNASLTHAAIVMGATRRQWITETPTRGHRPKLTYRCPLDRVRVVTL